MILHRARPKYLAELQVLYREKRDIEKAIRCLETYDLLRKKHSASISELKSKVRQAA